MISFSTNPNVVCVSTVQSECHILISTESSMWDCFRGMLSRRIRLYLSDSPERRHQSTGISWVDWQCQPDHRIQKASGDWRRDRRALSRSWIHILHRWRSYRRNRGINEVFVPRRCWIRSVPHGNDHLRSWLLRYTVQNGDPITASDRSRVGQVLSAIAETCSWRLDTTRTTTGYNNNQRTYVSYHVSSISPVAEEVTCWLCPDSTRLSSTLAMRLLRCMAVAGSHQRPTFRTTQHGPRTVKPREHFVVNVACHCRIRMPNSVHRVVIHSTSTRTRSQAYPMNETPCNKLQFLSRFG